MLKKLLFQSKHLICILETVIVLLLLTNASAFGAGFRVYSQSTSSASQGDAMVAHFEDASTMFYNPAAMTKAPSSEILLDYVSFTPSTEFTSSSGSTTKAKTSTFHIPHIHFLHKLNDKAVLGIATVFPYGLAREWPEDWEGRYLNTRAELNTYTLNPNFAFAVSPSFSMGFGLSYMNSDVAFEQNINSSAFLGVPADDVSSKLEGQGTGWGYNLGALLDITEKIRMGVSYRSRIKVDYEGDAEYDIPPSASPLAALLVEQDISATIKFPAVFVIGINTSVSDHLDLELDADWTDWSTHDSLAISFEDGTESVKPKDYKDAWTIHLGGRYRINDAALIRFGYYYDMTPVPEESVDPLLPDADKHGLSVGMKYKISKIALNVGYQGVFFDKRSTSENIDGFNGEYESVLHLAGASAQYYF